MRKIGFTPGPWHNQSKNFGYGASHVCGPKHQDGGDYAPICVADTAENAALIAASPEMFERLIASNNILNNLIHDLNRIADNIVLEGLRTTVKKNLDVLAKAIGE